MKVLLSAVGKSDPMTIFKNSDVHDGSMIHICRYYLPDKLYLYMSKQICEFDEKDDRYSKSIQLLEKLNHHHYDIVKIKNRDLEDVHKFDKFYDEFESIILNIVNEYGEDVEILLNISSGTPAMKSAFQIIAALSKYNIMPVQVSDPCKGAYQRDDNLVDYLVEDYWELNLDNESVDSIRCFVSDNRKFNFKIQKEIIINLINEYDYEAANSLIQSNAKKFNSQIIKMSEFALARYKLDKANYLKIQKELGQELIPYKQSEKIKLFEYALWLKLKVDKSDLLDVVRGINPFMYEASKVALKELYSIDIEKYLTDIILTRKNLEKDIIGKDILKCLDEKYKSYKDKFLTEEQMILYITYKNTNKALIHYFKELNQFRYQLRNEASHQIVCIQEDIIQRKVKHSTQYYIDCIKNILDILGYDTKKYWDSYDKMNGQFINMIRS